MIIDAHQHTFWHDKSDADLVANLDEHGIDLAWLLAWEIPPEEDAPGLARCLNPCNVRADGTHGGITLRDLILARDRYPERFVLGYAPDPRKSDAAALFEAAYHMHGVRVCGEWKFRMLLDDPRCLLLFRKAGELGCPVVVHIDVPYLADANTGQVRYAPAWYGGTVANLRRACEACPKTTFLGHGPGFWREISGDADSAPKEYPDGPVAPGGRIADLLDSLPNLCCDLSAGSGRGALARDPEHARRFVLRYADRLLFARDYYDGLLHKVLESLDLPADVREKVYHENAARLVPPPGKD